MNSPGLGAQRCKVTNEINPLIGSRRAPDSTAEDYTAEDSTAELYLPRTLWRIFFQNADSMAEFLLRQTKQIYNKHTYIMNNITNHSSNYTSNYTKHYTWAGFLPGILHVYVDWGADYWNTHSSRKVPSFFLERLRPDNKQNEPDEQLLGVVE